MKKIIFALAFVLIGSSWVKAQAQTIEPPNNMSEIAAYSVYVSHYRNENYQNALKFGRWILLSMPETIEGYPKFDLSLNLSRFATIYTTLAENADDPAAKAAYVDTVQTIYSKVFNSFSKNEIDTYSWLIRKGRFYQDYADILGNQAKETSIEAYSTAFDLKPEKMTTSYKGYYVKVLLRSLADIDSDSSKQKALFIIAKAEPYANEELGEYFDDIRRQLFDEPAERIAFLESELKENPENLQALRQLRTLYKRQGDTEKVLEINRKLYKLDPSYQTVTALGEYAMGHANYQEAIKYFEEALNKTDDPNKSKRIYLNLANAEFNLDNLQQARNYAQQAINIDPDWGRPYLQIASIYARVVNNCTNGRDLTSDDRAVYWLVLDYAQKAKRVDPSVSSRANTLLQIYRPVTPTQQDIFFNDNWAEGESIRIDASLGACYGWINETTTVR